MGSPALINGGNTVVLDHAVLTPTFSVPDEVLSTSLFTRKRNWKTYGDYAEFEIVVNLHKYCVEIDGITPRDKFIQIYALNHADVYFKACADGAILKDGSGASVFFHVTDITPYYLNDIIDYDMVIIKLQSATYVDLAACLADPATWTLEGGGHVVDENGWHVIL